MKFSDAWSKRLLLLAAAWSFLAAITAFLDPAQHFGLLYEGSLSLSDPLQRFFYNSTWISVLGWGTTYLFAALMPGARKPILIAGGLGKVAFFVACVQLYQSGVGKTPILIAGSVDLALAVIFGLILL